MEGDGKNKILILLFLLISAYSFVGRASAESLGPAPASFGMNTVVLPNPDNTLYQELLKREKELDAKEASLRERELKINNAILNVKKRESYLMNSLIILICLFAVNLFLISRNPKIDPNV